MTYEGSAHRTIEEQAEVAESIRRTVARAEKARKARRRDNIEDLLLVVFVAVAALIIGMRIEAVYLHDHKPVSCSSEDMIPVETTESSFGQPAGTAACVHLDALKIP